MGEHETEARHRSLALEHAGKLPAGYTDTYYPLTRSEQLELRRLKAALAAAPDADIFCALVRGEPVPASRLNPDVVAAHRRRIAA